MAEHEYHEHGRDETNEHERRQRETIHADPVPTLPLCREHGEKLDRIIASQARVEERLHVVEKLEDTIWGTSDSNPGLKTTVDRHEQVMKDLQRAKWAGIVVIVGAIGSGLVWIIQAMGRKA